MARSSQTHISSTERERCPAGSHFCAICRWYALLWRCCFVVGASCGSKFLVILLLTVLSIPSYGQLVRISLFNEIPVKCIVVSTLKGSYTVFGDSSRLMDLTGNDAMYITLFDKHLLLRNSQRIIGDFTLLRFAAESSDGVIRVNLIDPRGETRQYADNLLVSVAYCRLSVINEVQPDNYVAGVVDAEAGPNAMIEFYKAQSVLARTYLYGHTNRHSAEGFDMCDGVHCQAYKGRSVRNPIIAEATRQTTGLVVVGADSAYITAAFHANCGGETESAANAWLSRKSYLVPVKDPFCQNSSTAKWEKSFPLNQWQTYLKGHGFKLPKGMSPGALDFLQVNRRSFYVVGNDSLPTKQIRTDFNLRSSFFSVVASPKEITLRGRGFGHGVGLCQDGAMQMAKIGYNYIDILSYYYKNISIVTRSLVK